MRYGVGELSRDAVYERARYMLERIIPVAERCGVQMACHLEDPPAPHLAGYDYPLPLIVMPAAEPAVRTGCMHAACYVVIEYTIHCSVEMWNWPVFEGCKRFSELVNSPYHGFNFCCGTASEGLDDPATELCPIVNYFAEKKKIFHIRQFHFCGCATPP